MSFTAQVTLGFGVALAFLAVDLVAGRLLFGNRARRRAYDRGYDDGFDMASRLAQGDDDDDDDVPPLPHQGRGGHHAEYARREIGERWPMV